MDFTSSPTPTMLNSQHNCVQQRYELQMPAGPHITIYSIPDGSFAVTQSSPQNMNDDNDRSGNHASGE
jgi:hypothetical protein